MKRILLYLAPLCLVLPALASATEGYIVADISLQAGPDTEYPSITELAAGTPVEIQGCIDGYTWCDVIAGEDRGWVAGSFVEEEYENQPVVIEDYGPRFGIPIVTFSLGTYWGSHYHNRPWFNERTRWEGRHIRPHQPPRPSVEAIRNAPRVHAGNLGNRDHNRPTPAAAPVAAPAPAPTVYPQRQTQTPTQTQNPRTEMERQRAQPRPAPAAVTPPPPPHPVATGPKQEPPHPVAEHKPPPARDTPPVRQAPPKAEPRANKQPKAKEEPKKDDGHKDDSKEH
jgi:uncharacterized protein YraI